MPKLQGMITRASSGIGRDAALRDSARGTQPARGKSQNTKPKHAVKQHAWVFNLSAFKYKMDSSGISFYSGNFTNNTTVLIFFIIP